MSSGSVSLFLSGNDMFSQEVPIPLGTGRNIIILHLQHFGSDIGNTPGECMGLGKESVLPSKPELHDSAVDHGNSGSTVGLGCSISALGLVWPLASLQI